MTVMSVLSIGVPAAVMYYKLVTSPLWLVLRQTCTTPSNKCRRNSGAARP